MEGTRSSPIIEPTANDGNHQEAPHEAENITTSDAESDEESNESNNSQLRQLSRILRDNSSNRKKPNPEEKLSKNIANLTKKLLDTASRMKLKIFRKEDIPLQRRRKFQEFVQSIIPVLRIDKTTQKMLKDWPVVHLTTAKEAQVAFYSLLHAYVDQHYRTYLHRHPDDGCAAFMALQSYCAQNTAEDRAHYSRTLLSLQQGPQEGACQYIERFNTALEMATIVGNTYEENYITDLLIQGFGNQFKYAATVSMLKESRRREEATKEFTINRSSIESTFAAIDEYTQSKRHNAFSAQPSNSYNRRDQNSGRGGSGSDPGNNRGHSNGSGRSNGGRGDGGGAKIEVEVAEAEAEVEQEEEVRV
ncbi:MAG: hypothetical protein ACREOZ_05110, partial [Gloeomargaritales cyanobacterium]